MLHSRGRLLARRRQVDGDSDMNVIEELDRGLTYDITTLLTRRKALRLIAGAGLATIVGCTPAAVSNSTAGTSATGSTGTTAAGGTTAGTGSGEECAVIAERTAGPFPGNGSNGPNVLTESGVVRQDIRSSFGSATGVAGGIPLVIKLAIQDQASGCAAMAGAAVYLWHCDRGGLYSIYSDGVTDENYLRGVQEADAGGVVTFTSIFPGCYQGRWPHIHFEVYSSLEAAADEQNKIATSQVAFPQDICDQVYATEGYEDSVGALAQLSLETDNVFGEDGGAHQLGTMSGTIESGLTVELAVPV